MCIPYKLDTFVNEYSIEIHKWWLDASGKSQSP